MPSEQPVAPWPAPVAAAPVDATVTLPGSKSATNRALVLAALANGPSHLRAPLRSRDTALMAAALSALGTRIAEGDGDLLVMPRGLTGPATVDVGNAGTVMRFVPPVAALAAGPVRFDGDPRARERPIGPLLAALRALGAQVDDDGRGALPLTVNGGGAVAGGAVTLDSSGSSQLVSGLLLSGPRFEKGVEVRHSGPPVPSQPHLAMTVAALREFGAEVDDDMPDVWRVSPGPLTGHELTIEPDLSNAAPFCAAALVTGGRVTIAGWPRQTTQPGSELPELLTTMGAACELTGEGLTVRGGASIRGIEANLRDVPELTTTIAVLAALADSPSTITGVAHTRLQETDRLAALARELTALGGDITELPDGLEIRPRPLTGGVFATYDDHRLATAAALLGLAVPGVAVENVATTGKTMPGFTDLWDHMLAGRPT
ncbi:MAG TPA: 3-phosphoshikimate 1-carboxyvinyltransferase [Streptosporangiaceae bacterium]|jgi:3-phosphoshikimate 1-carboxyvinyltransferase